MADKKKPGTRLGGPKSFTKKTVDQLPNDKPTMYVLERGGKPVYAGVAQRGRLQERLNEHLNQNTAPGATGVRVRPTSSIDDARKAEEQFIRRERPRFNDQHNPDK